MQIASSLSAAFALTPYSAAELYNLANMQRGLERRLTGGGAGLDDAARKARQPRPASGLLRVFQDVSHMGMKL